MGLIVVGGVHGVGKTTTIERSVKEIEFFVPILQGGKIIAEFLGVSTEDIPYVDEKERTLARKYMYRRFREMEIGIKDAHYSVYTDTGYEILFDEMDKGHIVATVLLVAPAPVILERRKRTGKNRPLSIHQIKKHSLIEKEAASLYAKKMEVPLFEIENLEGSDYAVGQLTEIIRRYYS